jgi:hypothetical protein
MEDVSVLAAMVAALDEDTVDLFTFPSGRPHKPVWLKCRAAREAAGSENKPIDVVVRP